MKVHCLRLLALSSFAALGACADTSGPSGPGVEIAVAPLTLPNVLGVEYAVAVFNADPGTSNIFALDGTVLNVTNLVWQQGSLTSGQYGNAAGGDISYIGTCDADVPSGKNWVALDLKQVNVGPGNGTYNGTAPFAGTNNVLDDQNSALLGDMDADFVNPSPYNDALVLSFDCNENEDTQVVFNLTVMRDAEQGFFDIAVNFQDIFCSMKFDNCYNGGAGGPIELLFGDGQGEAGVVDGPGRDHTAVFGMACTAGPGNDIDTEILFGNVVITCGGKTVTLPLKDLEQGNNSVYVDANDDNSTTHQIQYGLYYGDEALSCDDNTTVNVVESCNKAYFNIALNLEDLPLDCTLSLQATAQDANVTEPVIDETGSVTGIGTSYPFVTLTSAPLTDTCFAWSPGEQGSPLGIKYGTTDDFTNPHKADVMCVRSNGGSPKALRNTGRSATQNYTTLATAEKVGLQSFGRFKEFAAPLRDPCTGDFTDPVTAQTTRYLTSDIAISSPKYRLNSIGIEASVKTREAFNKANVLISIGAINDTQSFELAKYNNVADFTKAAGVLLSDDRLNAKVASVYAAIILDETTAKQLGQAAKDEGVAGYLLTFNVDFNQQ